MIMFFCFVISILLLICTLQYFLISSANTHTQDPVSTMVMYILKWWCTCYLYQNSDWDILFWILYTVSSFRWPGLRYSWFNWIRYWWICQAFNFDKDQQKIHFVTCKLNKTIDISTNWLNYRALSLPLTNLYLSWNCWSLCYVMLC